MSPLTPKEEAEATEVLDGCATNLRFVLRPGSTEARAAGCRCLVLKNGVYIVRGICPIHGTTASAPDPDGAP